MFRPEFHPALAMHIGTALPGLRHAHDTDRLPILGKDVLDVTVNWERQTAQFAGIHISLFGPMPPDSGAFPLNACQCQDVQDGTIRGR